jgi:uncharacterized protein (TIGR03437 family)
MISLAAISSAAPRDRVARPVDAGRTHAIPGSVHPSAQPGYDRGAVDPDMRMEYMVLVTKPSGAQQADLEQLLADQQNPASPRYHGWLTPEEFGARFGLSPGDYSTVAAWLNSAGLMVKDTARGRNWVAFSGTAGQVSRALGTPIHRFEVNGKMHFANTAEIAVPEALADVIDGFLGLNDFYLQPLTSAVHPMYTGSSAHYLAPADFATIYNVAPLYQAGMDGTGQSIAIVGESDVLLSDIRAFRTRYKLPANDPTVMLYGGTDPGYNSSQVEGDLDLEWAGAIAPKATLYYIYGEDAFTALVNAVNLNAAPIISVSYLGCEVEFRGSYWRSIAQQASAQGITILNSSGDAGAAGCDLQSSEPYATRGRMVTFPSALPEVTGVGGTQFVEGSGNYWASTNSSSYGSALSYIPEAAWNESDATGLGSSGGGASLFYPQPAWQSGPGVPADGARHVPDVALSAAMHDGYVITYEGANYAMGGTSASAPSMAGIVALLNQYQVSKGFQSQAGLGNINPQLYRLAQAAPAVFHDIIAGNNIVPCAQGSPDCLTGSFGYAAAAGYDMPTGLGSVDANALVTQWNTATEGVSVNLLVNATRATVNDTVSLTALVNPAAGGGTPTGSVDFSANGVPLGSVKLVSRANEGQAADLNFPAYLLGLGTFALVAEYSGDAAFSSGGAEKTIRITAPTGVAAIVPTWPDTVWPSAPDAQGLVWQTNLGLSEVAGVAAMVTGFSIDGQAQPLSQYFPSPAIPAGGTVSTSVVFRNLAAPLARKFEFTGVDAGGRQWSREVSVDYFPPAPAEDFSLTATPLTVAQDPTADSACQWPVHLSVDEIGGYPDVLSGLYAGGRDLSASIVSIFGTTRLNAWGSLQGVVCYGGLTTPGTSLIEVDLSSGWAHDLTVQFTGPAAAASQLSAAPASISMAAPDTSRPALGTLTIGMSGTAQPWTASIFPANRTTAWLTASQLSGTGPGQIALSASGAGFEPGAYRALIVVQSAGATPESVTIPVLFVYGPNNSGMSITGAVNAASFQSLASPGMTLSVFGSKLAGVTQPVSGSPVPYSTAGVSATVNGVAAPVLYLSPNQLNIQVPYEVGAGPAVLGIGNNGDVAGILFWIAPAAPGIYTDPKGNLPGAPVSPGETVFLTMTGGGEVSPPLATVWVPTLGIGSPVLPLSVMVDGFPALVQAAYLAAGAPGTMTVGFVVPAVGSGPQPVVVTVGGIASAPATLTVQTATPSR